VVLYAGRIGLGIEFSLKLIAKAIQDINASLGLSVKLVFRTEDKLNWMNDYSCVDHQPYASYSEMPGILAEADILMLPYDFSEESIRFIKYSMPTKATEYMISGTPVVVFAPSDTAIVNYAKKYNCFELVTENSLERLSQSLTRLIQDEHTRRQLGEKAKEIAETHHAADIVTRQFREALSSLQHKHLAEKAFI
jgi:glycosyltransferase involved in cell wall biosynthesis